MVGLAALEGGCLELSDQEILGRSQALHARARAGEPRDALRAPFFALVREASRRVLGQRPFDVQVVAALALDEGTSSRCSRARGRR